MGESERGRLAVPECLALVGLQPVGHVYWYMAFVLLCVGRVVISWKFLFYARTTWASAKFMSLWLAKCNTW